MASKTNDGGGGRSVWKIALGVVLGLGLFVTVLVVGCAALIGSAADSVDKEAQAHSITKKEFRQMPLGLSQATVIERYGKPEDAQKFESQSFYGSGTDKSSCIYYNESGKGLFEGSSFQLCFTDGVLDSKNAY